MAQTKAQKAIIKRWVSALRSRKYKKGTGVLRRRHHEKRDTFCCLGVLCELAVKAGVIPSARQEEYSYAFKYGVGRGVDDTVLPRVVMNWAGLATDTGDFRRKGNLTNLAELNDGVLAKRPLTFSEIANVIESNPEGLFV